jgi:AcrR family transcriptional regulator
MTVTPAIKRSTTKQVAPTTHLGRRERNKLEKRARIVAAARRLFNRQGFAETTTLQIAEAADIGTGTLFLYARSKEDLLVMVFKDEMMDVALGLFQKLPDNANLVDQLLAVFAGMIDYHARDIDLTRLLMREIIIPSESDRRSAMDDLTELIFGNLGNLVDRARVQGQIDQQFDPELTGRTIFAIYYFDLLSWLAGRLDREELLVRLRRELETFLRIDKS